MLEEAKAVKEIVKANATAVYSDAAQPAVRVVGKSLAQCASLFATPVGRMAEIFESNIHRYLDKLEGISEEDLVSPDTRVLVPILEKLRFTDEEKVAEYYTEILATASKKEHANKVMITFIEILNRLTADEILILELVNSKNNKVTVPALTEEEAKQCGLAEGTTELAIPGGFPIVDVKKTTKDQPGYNVLKNNLNSVVDLVELSAPENIDSYINNMVSLGLLERKFGVTYAISKIYHHLENHVNALAIKDRVESQEGNKIEFDKGRIDITDLGLKLLSLCKDNRARDTIKPESESN